MTAREEALVHAAAVVVNPPLMEHNPAKGWNDLRRALAVYSDDTTEDVFDDEGLADYDPPQNWWFL